MYLSQVLSGLRKSVDWGEKSYFLIESGEECLGLNTLMLWWWVLARVVLRLHIT